MKTLVNILAILALGLAVNAQSVHENFNVDNLSVLDQQMPDVQDEGNLVLVQAFNANTLGGIHSIDADIEGDLVVKSYPNPASDHLTLEIANFSAKDHIDISIFNTNGQELGNWQLVEAFSTSGTYHLNISNLPKGTYVLQVKNNNTNLNQTKLIEKF